MSPAVDAQARGAAEVAQQQQKQLQQHQQQQHCYLEGGVMLEPFVHQVGGHSCVLRFGEQTICKPLVPREHQFYKSLPAPMRKFTPQYRGVVSVSFEEDEEGDLCLIAYPLHSDLENKDPSADSQPKSKMLKWSNKMAPSPLADNEIYGKEVRSRHSRKDKDKSGHKLPEDVELEWMHKAEVLYCRLEPSQSSAVTHHNPWILKCHQQHLQRMKDNAKNRNQYKFILLENLTWRHELPCVLDLKMGTRQHGDDASEEKKAMQIRKCQQSTSASIGVRLCGMQVYRSDSGQLMFMNKYHGRKLSLPGFKEALFQFFHDGQRLRRELLLPVLRRLREMKAALEACESYRFYSSSLLILYDGEPQRAAPARHHAEQGLSEEDEEEEDEEEEDKGEDLDEESVEEEEEEGGVRVAGGRDVPHSPSASGGGTSPAARRQRRADPPDHPGCPAVDVRMIDFAHTTCRHYGEDSVVHEGQDSGYIFGLQNLITIISQLEEHSAD